MKITTTPLPLDGGGCGWGWIEWVTPHLNPPPQGGRMCSWVIFYVIQGDKIALVTQPQSGEGGVSGDINVRR
jgi:hypothetical protein